MKLQTHNKVHAHAKAYLVPGLAGLLALAAGLAGRVGNPSEKAAAKAPTTRRHEARWQDKSLSSRTTPSSVGRASRARGAAALSAPVVLTQLPAGTDLERQPPIAAGMLRASYGDGARIIVLNPDGPRRVLTEGFHSASDPDISFDGKRILFAAKKRASDPWNIYEMEADGSDARQITRGLGNCRSPIYQSKLNTLVADRPWYQITFVSTARGELNEFGPIPSSSLYSSKLDGTFVSGLTFNPSSSFDPFLNWDGRLIFATWQRSRLERGWLGRVGLFELNQDGTDLMLLCADQGRRIKHMPTVTTDGLAVFVEADQVGWDGAGFLSAVTLRRPLHSYRRITRAADGLFHSPSPLPDGRILVSRRPRDGSATHGVFWLDPNTGHFEPIFDDPKYHDIQAKILAPRAEPDGRSSSVFVATGDIDEPGVKESFVPKNPRGKLYCLNVYISDLDRSQWLPRGTVKRVRVLEGLPRRGEDVRSLLPAGLSIGISGPGSSTAGIPPILPRRFLGEIPIEDDGSFNIEVPADIPIEIQLLDADGMALRSCGWIWVKNNEPRGCIGCHEDPGLTPENRMVKAVMRPSTPLTLPPERRRRVDFQRDLMPVIEARCVSCHASEKNPRLDGGSELVDHEGHAYFNRAYETLLAAHEPASGQGSVLGRYVHAGRARTSPLIWHIFGRNTSRPWDLRGGSAVTVKPMPPSQAEPLTEDEKRTFVEWIDTGALWGLAPTQAHASNANHAGVGRSQ